MSQMEDESEMMAQDQMDMYGDQMMGDEDGMDEEYGDHMDQEGMMQEYDQEDAMGVSKSIWCHVDRVLYLKLITYL